MKTDLVVNGYIFHNNKLLLIHHNKLDMWLPPGGHIEKNETPDHALLREIKEETNLDVEILNQPKIKIAGTTKENLATPFHTNVHNVGDHDHCGLFYLCNAKNPGQLKINKESKGYKWLSIEELENSAPDGIKEVAKEAFKIINLYKKQL